MLVSFPARLVVCNYPIANSLIIFFDKAVNPAGSDMEIYLNAIS